MQITRLYKHFDVDIFLEPNEYDQYPDGVVINAIVEVTSSTKHFKFFIEDEPLKDSEIVDDLRDFLQDIK